MPDNQPHWPRRVTPLPDIGAVPEPEEAEDDDALEAEADVAEVRAPVAKKPPAKKPPAKKPRAKQPPAERSAGVANPAPKRPTVLEEPEVVAVAVLQPRGISIPRQDLIRYVVFVVALAVIGAIVAFGLTKLGTPVYGARSELQYQLNRDQATEFLRTDRGLTTQLLRIKSRQVLLPVAEKNKLTYDELAAKVSATLVGESEIIRIQVADPSKEVADKLVTDVAAKYMQVVRTTPAAEAETEKYLTDQLAQADAERAALTARQAQLYRANPSNVLTPEQLSVQAEIASLLDQRINLKAQLDEAKVEGINEAKVSQLTEPYVLDAPVAPKPMKNAVAGGMAGLLLGLVAAMFLVRRRVARNPRGA